MAAIHPVFHVSLLEPYYTSNIPGRHQAPPPPIEIEGENEYEVNTILDSRVRRRRLEYLVAWTGYEDQEDAVTWEPAKNLTHVSDLVQEFHEEHPDKPGPDGV